MLIYIGSLALTCCMENGLVVKFTWSMTMKNGSPLYNYQADETLSIIVRITKSYLAYFSPQTSGTFQRYVCFINVPSAGVILDIGGNTAAKPWGDVPPTSL